MEFRNQDSEERNSLVLQNAKLAQYFARKYSNRGISYHELLSSAYMGLIAASKHFSPEKGTFGMASFYYIRGSIFNEFRDNRFIKLPRRKSDALMLIRKAIARLEQKMKRGPTISELQIETGIDGTSIRTILENEQTEIVSFDSTINDEMPLSEQIGDDTLSVDQVALDSEFWDRVKLLLSGEEYQIIRSHFISDNTIQEISTEFNRTYDSIRQIIKRSCEKLKKLRHCLN